jgi:hypothetical protein
MAPSSWKPGSKQPSTADQTLTDVDSVASSSSGPLRLVASVMPLEPDTLKHRARRATVAKDGEVSGRGRMRSALCIARPCSARQRPGCLLFPTPKAAGVAPWNRALPGATLVVAIAVTLSCEDIYSWGSMWLAPQGCNRHPHRHLVRTRILVGPSIPPACVHAAHHSEIRSEGAPDPCWTAHLTWLRAGGDGARAAGNAGNGMALDERRMCSACDAVNAMTRRSAISRWPTLSFPFRDVMSREQREAYRLSPHPWRRKTLRT